MKRLCALVLLVLASICTFGTLQSDARLLRGSVPIFEGLVASRARMLQSVSPDTTNKFIMARSAHIATESLSSIKIVFSNFYNNGYLGTAGNPADFGLGASSSITASVEYPAGTFTQILFSGSSGGTIPDVSVLFSDYVSVSIPAGATFWVRTFWHNTGGALYNTWQNTFLGEATTLSSTSITDQTMSGTIVNSGSPSGVSLPPIAILAMTKNPSVIIIGDSIGAGFAETEDSSNTAAGFNAVRGVIARSLGNVPFLNLSASSSEAGTWLGNATARDLLAQKGSEMVIQLATNDIGSVPPSQIITEVQTIRTTLVRPGQKTYQATAIPRSTDPGTPAAAWTTLGQQTSVSNVDRTTFNTAVRAGIAGFTGFYDIASALESSQNSGLWIVTPSPPYGSGLHPNNAGSQLVVSSGVIGPATWP